MKTLPNYENAVIPIEKLRDYCLNMTHPIGKHKALVFLSALNFTSKDSTALSQIIKESLAHFPAISNLKDQHGERYYVDIKISNFDKQVWVRTSWIIKTNAFIPIMTSCYVISK